MKNDILYIIYKYTNKFLSFIINLFLSFLIFIQKDNEKEKRNKKINTR